MMFGGRSPLGRMPSAPGSIVPSPLAQTRGKEALHMKTLGYYNGEYGPLEQMRVPMNDRVCFFGDGVYEATTVENHIPYALDEHLQRMERSAAKLEIPLPMELQALRETLLEMTAKLDSGSSQLYWQLTRGTAPRTHAFPKDARPNLWITLRPFSMRDPNLSYGLLSVPDTRYFHCDVKTLNLIPNVMAAEKAARAGCEEAVFHRDGMVTEGSHSNMHILKNGVLQTAPLSNLILPGITRAQLLKLAREMGVPVLEKAFTLQEMFQADEAFFTSASAFCCRASTLDGKPIGGKDEALLSALRNAYLDKFRKETSAVNPYLEKRP